MNWVLRNLDPSPRLASRARFPIAIGTVSVREAALRISDEPR